MTECVTFRDLTLGYNSHRAVHHLNGVIRKGSLIAVVGANGSGKSTLMKGIVGVLTSTSGTCRIGSGVRFAYLPQQSDLYRSFPARVAVMSPYLEPLWGDRRQEIVFIGCDPMNEVHIRATLDAGLVAETDFSPGRWRDIADPFPLRKPWAA